MLTPVPIERIPYQWDEVLRLVGPAIDRSSRTIWDVLHSLLDGSSVLFRVRDGADGYLIASSGLVKGSNIRAAWVVFVGGQVAGGPKARIAATGRLMAEFEAIARLAKCKQIRVETSRPWRLPGFHEIERRGRTRVLMKVI